MRLFDYSQAVGKWREWSFRTVSLQKARQMEKDGEVEAIVRWDDGAERIVGWKRTSPARKRRQSPTTLTFGTMQAVVGATTGVGAEHEVEKFIMWPYIGDTRAVAVRPRTSHADGLRAEELLRAKRAA